jgi:hypothetical protein
MGRTTGVVDILRDLGIPAMHAVPSRDFDGECVSIPIGEAERVARLLTGSPITDREDGVTRRLIGRPQDLQVDDAPWQWEVDPSVSSADELVMHVYVSIPRDELDDVRTRLVEVTRRSRDETGPRLLL